MHNPLPLLHLLPLLLLDVVRTGIGFVAAVPKYDHTSVKAQFLPDAETYDRHPPEQMSIPSPAEMSPSQGLIQYIARCDKVAFQFRPNYALY